MIGCLFIAILLFLSVTPYGWLCVPRGTDAMTGCFEQKAEQARDPHSSAFIVIISSCYYCYYYFVRIRSSFDDLFYHVMYDHLSSVTMSTYSLCEWTGCPSKAKRMLPSLSRHVQVCTVLMGFVGCVLPVVCTCMYYIYACFLCAYYQHNSYQVFPSLSFPFSLHPTLSLPFLSLFSYPSSSLSLSLSSLFFLSPSSSLSLSPSSLFFLSLFRHIIVLVAINQYHLM